MRKPFQMRLPSAKKATTLLLCMMMGIVVDATKVVGNPYLDSGCRVYRHQSPPPSPTTPATSAETWLGLRVTTMVGGYGGDGGN
ncbi:hypothetical protein Tco_0009049 [Tanacetum coccineum]